jgi:hypothetical protein
MTRPIYIALHALAAAAFGFVLQTFVLGSTVEIALIWTLVLGVAAAGLAWHQTNR